MTNQTRQKTNGCIRASVRDLALTADDLLVKIRDLLPEWQIAYEYICKNEMHPNKICRGLPSAGGRWGLTGAW